VFRCRARAFVSHYEGMTNSRRSYFLVGGIVLALAALLSGGGLVFNWLSDPNGGANIGAGILLLAGLPVALIGLILLLVDLILYIPARADRRKVSR